MAKTPEILLPVGGVYRVPLRKVFNKKRVEGDPTWNDIYGGKKCVQCKQQFAEGDPYVVVVTMKKNSKGEETYEAIHKYKHVECK